MTDILINRVGVDTARLDTALRADLGAAIVGMSAGPYGVRVHFAAAPSPAEAARAQAIVMAHRSLALTADKTVLQADGSDTAVITCADSAIAADAAITYTVWLDGDEYTGLTSAPVAAGQVQLALTVSDPGVYRIEIARVGAGNYDTGDLTLNAVL